MTRKRSHKKVSRPLNELNHQKNILQTNRLASYAAEQNIDKTKSILSEPTIIEGIVEIKSLLDEPVPSTSKGTTSNNNLSTELLHNELDSFRQKWKRELGEAKESNDTKDIGKKSSLHDSNDKYLSNLLQNENKENVKQDKESSNLLRSSSSDKIYSRAKMLFLKAVDLERDEMHLESIRYYKEAMHLCPDIEKLIFQEQCMASVQENASKLLIKDNKFSEKNNLDNDDDELNKIPIYDRIAKNYYESNKEKSTYSVCRPTYKAKGTHFSDLPHELIIKIFYYIIGEELDLASLECLALTCRGFYLLSRDSLLWKSICYQTWGNATTSMVSSDLRNNLSENNNIDQFDYWRQMYLDRPRVNFDGVYISRTRYVRQGDVGFEDLTYRPFHTVRYYRYLRFFPDRRVFILTTNEEPEKIVPIFRHAIQSKQFSSDLSIFEGTYQFYGPNQINIIAEKDRLDTPNQKRQPQYWSRQTPISRKLNLKFELKTMENKPYKNNVLKWLEYTILTKLETGQELESFDLTYDMFPNLIFSRVKSFNLKSLNPLSSQW